MPTANTPLFNRSDTFFGVCEGLGSDIGVNPNLFRLAFAGLLFWNPLVCLATYVGLGVTIHALRWIMPDRAAAATVSADPVVQDEAPVEQRLAA